MHSAQDAQSGSATLGRKPERPAQEIDPVNRHLMFEHLVNPELARPRQKFEAASRLVRDLLAQRWLKTRMTRERENPKRVYYLSMEFLIGRMLTNNMINLQAEPQVRQALQRAGITLEQITELEPDAGLGNGGLGRLAACFIDSIATLQLSAMGYGLRYQYGIFKQQIQDGYQVEKPDNWLRQPDPWEIPRPGKAIKVPLGATIEMESGRLHLVPNKPSFLLGIAYDRPVVGYGARCVNTLRLWEATAPDSFDFADFSAGDFVGSVLHNVQAESLTRVLYPNDATLAGQTLRFLQEYFLVCCSLNDIVSRFRKSGNPQWHDLPNKVAIQLNDTHPALAVAELLRLLLDQGGLEWDEAWDLTVRTLAYTNHTLLPEALEKWPVQLFEQLLPRHLELIYEINRRFLDDVRLRYPGDEERIRRVSLIEDKPVRKVRMANLAIVGTHSTNGVAQIHSDLLKSTVVPELAEIFPQRFGNKTNGVTPRRWLLLANPDLSHLITEAIGDGWITDLAQLKRLGALAADSSVRASFRQARRRAKTRFASWLKAATGQVVDPEMLFDSQIKRIHEYKRQLLNALHIVVLYNRLREDPKANVLPRIFFFGGKAAPAYKLAKLIIKFINNMAAVIDADPAVRGRIKVLFLPDYNVSMAERLIPASDVSEQISTAGFEASGTSNMKFMMNGALTIGTRDGATIEMAQEAGEDNFFLFGLTAQQVSESRGWYDPWWHYHHEPQTQRALDLIFSNHFSRKEPGIFEPLRDVLLTRGDYYMHLADLKSYVETQARLAALAADPEAWARKAILNIAGSGKFSSDRTIAEYAADIWGAEPCPVP
jgi:starch phosphorylase